MRRAALALLTLAALACAPAAWSPPEPPEPAAVGALDPPVREQWEARHAAVRASPRDGTAWGELGLWFDAYDRWRAARTCYDAAWRLTDEPRWLELRAHAERLAGDAAAGRASFAELFRRDERARAARVWAGELELAAGRFDEAEELFTGALKRDDSLVRARAGLARVALERGDAERAARTLRGCLERQPESGTLHHLLGRALRELGDDEGAREHLGFAAAQGAGLQPVAMDDPLRAEVAALRASARSEGRRAGAALREGRFEDALTALRAAVEANPEDVAAGLNLARAQARLGEPEDAIATLDALLAREPANARALEVRALARSLAGDEEGALADFRASVAADPDNAGAHRQLARLLWSRGEVAASLPHWSRVAELEPADAQARYRRAEALARAGRWAEAVEALERDAEELPQPGPFRLLLARTLSVAPVPVRDGERALALALAEHERAPRLRQAETVALAHAANGDRESALAWQRAAAEAVRAAGAEDRHRWVLERLELLEAGGAEPLPCREDEGRGSLPVPAP